MAADCETCKKKYTDRDLRTAVGLTDVTGFIPGESDFDKVWRFLFANHDVDSLTPPPKYDVTGKW
jgi:hypothetical protein